MLYLKTEEEIEIIRENCLLVSKALAEVGKMIKPGVTTLVLDKRAEEFLRDHGAKPAFKGYKGFPSALCTSVNEQVVHGIPSDYELREGDIIAVDCGSYKNGFYGDSAYTFEVGEVKEEIRKLLRVTRECLMIGVEKAYEGNRIGDISYTIQMHAEANGFSVVRELVGHGIGKQLHEPPEVPNYGRRGYGMKMSKGLTICIEPMINLGKKNIRQEKDGWTITTIDQKPSAHYEYAIAITDDKPDILTNFEFIDEVLKGI